MHSSMICHHYDHHSGSDYIGAILVVGLVIIVVLIGCLIILVQIRKKKQRPGDTLTSVADGQQQSMDGQMDGQMGRHHGGYRGDPNNMPPMGSCIMGSAEAEFQNDFIQVFPMHHLEPMPEKNMSALIMQ